MMYLMRSGCMTTIKMVGIINEIADFLLIILRYIMSRKNEISSSYMSRDIEYIIYYIETGLKHFIIHPEYVEVIVLF